MRIVGNVLYGQRIKLYYVKILYTVSCIKKKFAKSNKHMQKAYNKNAVLFINCNISAHIYREIVYFWLANRRLSCQLYNSVAISNLYFIVIFIVLVNTKQIRCR